ncbi:hypothetical protein DK427_17735 [Methylobacterium radiodurans]|uniref:Uncharacterized protein n=1 Tax=Methylobacterium radiodurans TaxID=2202828 RepID=A0A2U8VUD8_9HYPH|nr:hypothetical protein DK427_17735 [Methylobacterium radiodurans]
MQTGAVPATATALADTSQVLIPKSLAKEVSRAFFLAAVREAVTRTAFAGPPGVNVPLLHWPNSTCAAVTRSPTFGRFRAA